MAASQLFSLVGITAHLCVPVATCTSVCVPEGAKVNDSCLPLPLCALFFIQFIVIIACVCAVLCEPRGQCLGAGSFLPRRALGFFPSTAGFRGLSFHGELHGLNSSCQACLATTSTCCAIFLALFLETGPLIEPGFH